jgi:murein DD-endopeptidase MepM/ murein hydrolase activator NlpD
MKKDIILSIFVSLLLIQTVDSLIKQGFITIKNTLKNEHVFLVPELKSECGIPIDAYNIEKGKIKPNQFISNILSSYNIPFTIIDALVKKSKDIFDFRKIRTGKTFTVFCTKDSLKKVEYFIYEKSPVDYVVVHLKDSIKISMFQKSIYSKEKVVSCTIKSSLWDALAEKNVDPELSNMLSDIYAWEIDFFGLQKGDNFNVIYEEKYVDSLFIGLGKVKAVCFNHLGKDFYAFPYKQDSVESYFDEQGKSLRKAFLKAPLKFARITSRFTNSRFHPILKIYRPHHGVDYAAPIGTPVLSIGDGVVIKTGYHGEAGNLVYVKHNGVYTSGYLHLSAYGSGIRSGSIVRQGDIVGYVGSTGSSTGPHLDFRCWQNGQAVDPIKIDAPPVEPIRSENIHTFYHVRDSLFTILKEKSKPLI